MTELSQDIGAGLRHAREQSGLSLRHIADATKLSTRSLAALENNRIEQLPGGIYRRSIVRAYASHVGLDPEKTLRTFLAKYPDDVPSMAQLIPQQAEPATRRAVHTVISLISALIPILGGIFYFTLSATGSDTPRHIVDVMPPRGVETWSGAIRQASLTTPDPVSMMVSVSARTRLQIVADGQEVVARVMAAGDVVRLDLSNDVVLVGDDAGAVHFSINGRAGRTLGDAGSPLTARISREDYQDWLIQP